MTGKLETLSDQYAVTTSPSVWQQRYGKTHRLQRLLDFPTGIHAPQRVRIYTRRDHFVLQWWDKSQKRTHSERVNGDLLTALSRAREIDERLEHFGAAHQGQPQTSHDELIAGYLADVDRRVEAGEIDLATASRYRSALNHYLDFVHQPNIARTFRRVSSVNHDFQLEFAGHLARVWTSRRGQARSTKSSKNGQSYVMDIVRSVFDWGADPERGNILPAGFLNPFAKRHSTRHSVGDPIRSLDITMDMAVHMLEVADQHQLGMFAPLMLYGLRPGELSWIFAEHAQEGWLRMVSLPELDYATKGRRDKRFPLLECLRELWNLNGTGRQGLIYSNSAVRQDSQRPTSYSLEAFAAEYRRRCKHRKTHSVPQRINERNHLLKEAGQLSYDHLEGQFQKVAQQLKWPAAATLKDLRHLFATSLENAGVPESYRRYFLGHSLGRAPIVAYTHITAEKIQEHYQRAVTMELAPIVHLLEQRVAALRRLICDAAA